MDRPYISKENIRMKASPPDDKTDAVRLIKCEDVFPDPLRPPRKYPDSELSAIADGFSKHGIGVPLVVMQEKQAGKTRFIIITGEKIFRAALIAKTERIPCEVIYPKSPENSAESSSAVAPPPANEKIVIGDPRFFFNSVDHAVKLMNRSGVGVACERSETESGTVIVITVPKSPPI